MLTVMLCDSGARFYNRDTVVLQGPRDADPLGSWHPQIDDLIQTSRSMIRTPERYEAFEMPVQQVCHARGSMICHDEDLKLSPCTRITPLTPGRNEPRKPLAGTKDYYELQDLKHLRLPKSKPFEPSDQTDSSEAHISLSNTSRPYASTNTLHGYTENPLSTYDFAFLRPQKSTESHEALGMPGRQVHDARGLMTRCEDTSKHSSYITAWR